MVKIEESVNPLVNRLNGYRQLCELLALLSFTVGAFGFLRLPGMSRWSWAVGSVLAFLFFLNLALHFARQAIREFKYGEFSITEQRRQTLKATRAPADLMDCLKALTGHRFRGEQNYFRHLSRMLTPTRIEELKNIIFKYTYVGRKQ